MNVLFRQALPKRWPSKVRFWRYLIRLVSRPTAALLQVQIGTHEVICAERLKETILRTGRNETVMIGSAGTTIVLLIGVMLGQ